jgi:hypothetical protein
VARDFDGSTGYLIADSSLGLGTKIPITLAAWVYLDAVGDASEAVFGFFNDGGFNDWLYLTKEDSGATSRVGVRCREGSGALNPNFIVAGDTAITVSTWTHIAATVSDGAQEVFLNGVSDGTAANTAANQPTLDRTTVGVNARSTGPTLSLYFNGRIAECAAWPVVLDDQEIAALAAGWPPHKIRPASLIRYLPVMGRQSPEIDLANGLAYTLNGTASVIEHHRVLHPVYPRALPFRRKAVAAVGGTIARQHYHHRHHNYAG